VNYKIHSIKELGVLIDHFDKYPLITQKLADYQLFKQAFDLISRKEHLTKDGLEKLVAIKASVNNGLSSDLKASFSSVISLPRPLIQNQEIKCPNWLAGFTSGEGNFFIHITDSKTHTIGSSVALKFAITQHSRDIQLIESFTKLFECGRTEFSSQGSAINFVVTKFSDINDKIIPYFNEYPIFSVKSLDFADFCKAAKLIKGKEHLTEVGLEKIKKIKSGMNRNRVFSTDSNLISSKIELKKTLGKRFLSTIHSMNNNALNTQRDLTSCSLNNINSHFFADFWVVKCYFSIGELGRLDKF
jgi:hypothetical protein